MEIDITKNDPVEVTTEAGNKYRLYRHGELHPKSPKPDDIKNRVYLRSQELYGKGLNTVEYYERYYQIKPKDKSKIIKLWYSTNKDYDYIVDCVFLEDCIPFNAEDNRQHLIPREEYKTEYQWKHEDDRSIKPDAEPVVIEFWSLEQHKYITAYFYHISDTEPTAYKTEYQWKLDGRKVKDYNDFQKRTFNINGIVKTYKYYHKDNTYLI